MEAMRSKHPLNTVSVKNYISPEIALFHIETEQGFCISQCSSDINIGIGDWEVEEEDFDIK